MTGIDLIDLMHKSHSRVLNSVVPFALSLSPVACRQFLNLQINTFINLSNYDYR